MSNDQIRVMMIVGRLGDGGKERQLLLLLKILQKHKDIFTCLISMNSGGERDKEAAQYVDVLEVFPDREKIDLISPIKRLKSLIKDHQINLIHTWGSGIWDLMGVCAGKRNGIPVLHNGIRSAPIRMNRFNRVTRLSALFADAVAAKSQAGLDAFGFSDRPKAKVIYNGLDPSRFGHINCEYVGHNLCMVANFQQRKDHESLVRAMPEILKSFPDTILTLIGHDYGTLNQVRDLVDALNLSENVDFITDCTQPEPIIGKCQIGILATNEAAHGEGISNAILEYMALAKPVIASRNGGNPEVVLDKDSGFLVHPGSSNEIYEKVNYFFSNPEIAKKMGAKGKSYVNEKFSLAKMEADYIEIYKSLLKNE